MNDTASTLSQASKDLRIERATHRALEQAREGNHPVLLREQVRSWATQQTWSIGSRTAGGSVYVIDATTDCNGTQTHCTCAAADSDRICWHRAAIRLAIFNDIPWTDGRRPVAHLASLGNADLFGFDSAAD